MMTEQQQYQLWLDNQRQMRKESAQTKAGYTLLGAGLAGLTYVGVRLVTGSDQAAKEAASIFGKI